MQSEIVDEDDFLEIMLAPASEHVSLKRNIYKVYIVYEYSHADGEITTASAIITLDEIPLSEKGILKIYEKFNSYKGFILQNIELLEE